jgi:hypothetical protein
MVRNSRHFLVFFVVLSLMCWRFSYRSVADEPVKSDPLAETRQTRMLALFDDVHLSYAKDPQRTLTRTPQPILKYTNPVNSSQLYASTFLWLDETVPVAVVSPSFRDSGNIYWEWTTLSTQPLELKRAEKSVWRPQTTGHTPVAMPEAPVPGETPAARLAQMRTMARRFRVTEVRRETTQEARMLSQPIHRWSSKSNGVTDAAMFAFTETTDPELLLIFESRESNGGAVHQWYYTLARMTSSPCEVFLDDQSVWTTEGYWKNPRSQLDPYFEAAIGKFEVKEIFP